VNERPGRLAFGFVVAVAATKVAAAFAGLAVGPGAPPSPVPAFAPAAMLIAYAAVGIVLLVVGRQDRRALYLGAGYLTFAAAFANRPVRWLAAALGPPAEQGALVLLHSEIDALFPLFFWLFVAQFPKAHTPPFVRRIASVAIATSGTIGAVLFAANLVLAHAHLTGREGIESGLLAPLLRDSEESLFYSLVLGLTLLGVVFLALRLKAAGLVERRRVRLFLTGLGIGFGLPIAAIMLEIVVPPFDRFLSDHARFQTAWTVLFLLPCALMAPITTAYAVLQQKVLDVRLIARRAIQYGLARSAVSALAAIPLTVLAVFLWIHRESTVREVLSGVSLVALLAASALGLFVIGYRKRLLEALDRRFFREQHDAWRILSLLRDQIRWTGSEADLADLVTAGIDRALHLETVALLLEREERGVYADPRERVRPLDASSTLMTLLGGGSEPLLVDLEDRSSPASRLPAGNRHWLVDSGAVLLVPLVGTDGRVAGILVLGDKRSGLPFLREDLELLETIADAAAAALELHQIRRRAGAGPRAAGALLPTAEVARECLSCGRIFLPRTPLCTTCSDPLEQAPVPYVLPGKLRFEERLGSGGMGVVYRAVDLSLGRPVAVKTLRRVSPEDAMRLRREARTAAAVSHPHLAAIHGFETWRGTPLLILEYLEGGTLDRRFKKGPLDPLEVIEIGIAIADALETLHSQDILHRDVKPSNIGFAGDATPKLTDFGIARLHLDTRSDAGGTSSTVDLDAELPPTSIWRETPSAQTQGDRLVGTLSYLSPEVAEGEPPGPELDVWALCLVLHEALTGSKVFRTGDRASTLDRIRRALVPPVRTLRPECPEPLEQLLKRALDRDPVRRPASARELRRELIAVRHELASVEPAR